MKSSLPLQQIAIVTLLVLAAVLRFHDLGKNSFWRDEFLSLKSSSGQTVSLASLPTNVLLRHPPVLTKLNPNAPWWRLWRIEDEEIHPPIYFILLRFWREAFGDSETAVRSLSALASIAAIVFFYGAIRLQASRSVALWAAALMTVAAPQIYMSQVARDYSLWMALGMAGAYALLAIEARGTSIGRLTGLGLCALALPLTHYFAALSVVSLVLYAILRLRGRSRILVIMSLLTAGLLFLLLWGKPLENQTYPGILWLTDLAQHHLLATAGRVIQIPLRSVSVMGNSIVPASIFFVLVVIALYLGRHDRRIVFWIIWFIPLFAATLTIDLVRHARMLDILRYTFVADVSFCALIPILSQRLFPRRWWIPAALMFLLCATSVPWAYPKPTEWRDVAAFLRKAVHPGDTVVYTAGHWRSEEALALYLGISHYAPSLPASTLLLTHIRAPIVQTLPHPGQSVWMICFQPDLPPQAIFPNAHVLQQMLLPNVGRICQLTSR